MSASLPDDVLTDVRTQRIVWATWGGTAVFGAMAVAGVAADSVQSVALAVDVVLFAVGAGVFLWALAIAASRSRTAEIGIGGLFFLAGSTAPAPVKRRLLGALATQVVVGVATASAEPFTPLAGGVLVPLYGLALCGLWGARLGRFGPR